MKRRLGFRNVLFCLVLASSCVSPGHAQEAERKIVKKVEVQYPSILKRRGIGGTVRLRVVVKPDGVVKDIDVLGGNAALADAAQVAVRQWRFAPGSTETSETVTVKFDPNS